jgi:hypothetical protein
MILSKVFLLLSCVALSMGSDLGSGFENDEDKLGSTGNIAVSWKYVFFYNNIMCIS